MNILQQDLSVAGTFIGALAPLFGAPRNLTVQAKIAYGSGGTTVDAYLQTSIDGGKTWVDIANFHFTTASAITIFNLSSQTPKTTAVAPTDGALAANTCVDGILGSRFRCKCVVVGNYVSSALSIDIVSEQSA